MVILRSHTDTIAVLRYMYTKYVAIIWTLVSVTVALWRSSLWGYTMDNRDVFHIVYSGKFSLGGGGGGVWGKI